MELSQYVDALLAAFEETKPHTKDLPHISVSRTVSILARIYEKARNAVEFRADHLVRRAAIERILKRKLLLGGNAAESAQSLVLELLWARYIDSGLISDATIAEINAIISRYLFLKTNLFPHTNRHQGLRWDAFLALASNEIEDLLVPAKRREALTNFVYQAVRPKIRVTTQDERIVNMQVYIAVERSFGQSDEPLIIFELLKIMQPEWFSLTGEGTADIHDQLVTNLLLIKKAMKDPVVEGETRFLRRQMPAFLLLRDFLFAHGEKSRSIIENEPDFEKLLAEIAHQRYQEIGAKVRRSVIRSIIYIFLTKMVFALALEAPFDIFITKRIEYLALAVNTLFPPILMFLVAGFVSTPGSENTTRLIARVKSIVYHFDDLKNESTVFSPHALNRRPILTAGFSVIYLITFLISFGLISYVLSAMHFNIASQIIFVFFVTLVSFFAYRIRTSAREYEIVERQGFLAPIVDFFFLPILWVGNVLSREISRLNVFIFFFDFILEAPLKVIFELVEEWIRFIRTKKEEIV